MRRAAWKLRLKVASHCSSVMSRKLVRACSPPALLTRASIRPSIGSRSTPTTVAPSSVSRRALA
jgi:hypothetical protein